MNRKYGLLLLVMVLLVIPARASINFSIVPITPTIHQGDNGDLFDVIMTSTASFSANSFSFEVSTVDTDVTFVSATISTTADPYIFAGNSLFGPNITSLTSLPQTLDASDLTADTLDITIPANTAFALGEVSFNIAGNATPGPFTVTFGNPNANFFSDEAADSIAVTGQQSQQFTIQAPVPEPSTLLPLSALVLGIGAALRRRSRR